MSRLIETLKRLRALERDERTPEHERQAARKARERILEASPELEGVLEAEALDEIELDIRYQDWQEEHLIAYVGWFLGLEIFNVSSRRAGGRKLKKLRVRGDPRLVAVVDQLVQDYKPKLAEQMRYFMFGWLNQTFPSPSEQDPDAPEPPKLTAAQLAALRAGQQLGERHRLDLPELEQSNAQIKGELS